MKEFQQSGKSSKSGKSSISYYLASKTENCYIRSKAANEFIKA